MARSLTSALQNQYFRFGLRGNQPFSTRLRCSKISKIDQKLENAVTPNSDATNQSSTKYDNTPHTIPSSKNAHQHLTPK